MTEVEIRLSRPLQELAGGAPQLRAEATTVEEAIAQLTDRFPALGARVRSPSGALRPGVAIYLNEEDIRNLERERTPLKAGDVLELVPALAGGRAPDRPPAGSALPPEWLRRYSRQILLPEVGLAGQRRLSESRVLVVGAGGLGSPIALYLAAAGVGELGLAEFDTVDLSNLQRQTLFSTSDVGRPKLAAARARLTALNPDVRVVEHPGRLEAEGALDTLRPYDVIVDGTDNFPTRYLVNDAAVLLHKPVVYGSVYRFEGQVSVFDAERGPCYRCLFAEPPPPGSVPSCAEGGVLGVLPGLVGTIQANETLKLLLGIGEPLIGRLLLIDALELAFRELRLQKSPDCPLCGPRPTQRGLIDYPAFCGVTDSGSPELAGRSISAEELAARLAAPEPPLVVDVRQPPEWAIGHIAGARLIPLDQLGEHAGELARSAEVVLYCKSGVRSARGLAVLRGLGFERVLHLEGGLDAWAERIDPTLPRY